MSRDDGVYVFVVSKSKIYVIWMQCIENLLDSLPYDTDKLAELDQQVKQYPATSFLCKSFNEAMSKAVELETSEHTEYGIQIFAYTMYDPLQTTSFETIIMDFIEQQKTL